MPRKQGDMGVLGHIEHVYLSDADIGFDARTLADAHRVMGEEIARRRAQDDQSTRAMAAAWHQMAHALTSLEEHMADRHDHAVKARELADQRLRDMGLVA